MSNESKMLIKKVIMNQINELKNDIGQYQINDPTLFSGNIKIKEREIEQLNIAMEELDNL